VIEGISSALEHLKIDLGKVTNAVRRIDSLEIQVAEVYDLKSDIGTLSSTASDIDSSLKHLKADFQTVTEQVCVLKLVPQITTNKDFLLSRCQKIHPVWVISMQK